MFDVPQKNRAISPILQKSIDFPFSSQSTDDCEEQVINASTELKSSSSKWNRDDKFLKTVHQIPDQVKLHMLLAVNLGQA